MKSIAILGTRGIPARYGGFETFAEQVSIGLARRGVKVTVYCPDSENRPSQIYHGVTLKYVKYPSLGSYSVMIWDALCFIQARRQYDVVYMLGVGGSFAAWIPRLFGSEVWINSDGLEWKRSKFTWIQRAYLAFAEALSVVFSSRIIADAEAIAAYLKRRYFGLKSVSTIAYGAEIPEQSLNTEVLREFELSPRSYYLVVCRLEPENHVSEIIEGFKLTQSQFPLVIVGDVERPNPYVESLLASRSAQIRFLGTVFDKERLNSLRANARAYLHGHSVGGTNPSLLEAMACSSLVVAHDNPFNREVLGDSGFYFKASDDLATVLQMIERTGSDEICALRQNALMRIRSRYQWDQVVDSYLKLLTTDR